MRQSDLSRAVKMFSVAAAATLMLAGCGSSGDNAEEVADHARSVQPSTVTRVDLTEFAQTTLNDPEAMWGVMTAECRDTVGATLGGSDGVAGLVSAAMPISIESADVDAGAVTTVDAAGDQHTEMFVNSGDTWTLGCEDGILREAVTAQTDEVDDSMRAESATPVERPQNEPATFACGDPSLYERGTAIYSDGTTGFEAQCGPGITNPYGPQSRGDAVVAPGQEFSDFGQPVERIDGIAGVDTNGDGVLSGFERCGTSCGDAPTSGEIQTKNGCEQGWITDEALCSKVDW